MFLIGNNHTLKFIVSKPGINIKKEKEGKRKKGREKEKEKKIELREAGKYLP